MDRFQGHAEPEASLAATPAEVFEIAQVRKTELELSYAGAVTPPEAWQLVQQKAAVLIDVRTAPEFKFVGRVPGTVNDPRPLVGRAAGHARHESCGPKRASVS